jgi:hypothetical protein
MVVCIALDDYVLEGVPACPYIVWRDRVIEILARYELQESYPSNTRVVFFYYD